MGIKGLCTIFFLLIANVCLSQKTSGTILDSENKMPICHANISKGKAVTFSDLQGTFTLAALKEHDTLLISKDGFRTRAVILREQQTGGDLVIYLSRIAVALKEVQIRAKERYKQDSLRIRKDFSNVFNYKPPRITDAFISRSAENRFGGFRDPNSNSTASIVNLDVLQIVGMFAQRRNSISKLQKIMLQQEQNKSVDQSFSKLRISTITALTGDSLLMFMNQYRPSPMEIQSMTDYELLLYIKRSYKKFIKMDEKKEALPPLKQDKH
jgi:RNase P protein component